MINVVSISPAKNTTNFNVNEDIQIRVEAAYPLDPRNVRFLINEVELPINCFSVYNGGTSYELDITLYTKRRIKYQNEARYGQDGQRYGMRDDNPSILEYGSRYVCEFNVWANDDQGVEQTVTDRFVFTTEEGIFLNDNPPEYYYSEATQGISNYMPEWSKARSDKFSNAQQMLNPLGDKLEKMQKFVVKQKLNSFIQTTELNQLSRMFRVELDKDMEIKSSLNEDGSLFYVQPEISAIQNITRFDLFTSENNNLEGSYYNTLPTRIGTEKSRIEESVIAGPIEATQIKEVLDAELEREGSVCLRVQGLSSSIYKTERGTIVFLKCRIKGESLFGREQQEDIPLFDGRPVFSRNLYRKIDSIQFFNLYSEKITYTLSLFREPLSLIQDSFNYTTTEDDSERIFWEAEKRNNKTILKKKITLGDTAGRLLRNAGRTVEVQETELLDIDNESSLDLIDVAPDLFEDRLYAVDSEYLYVYDKREEYPTVLKQISGDNGLADFVIDLDSDELGLDENGEKEIAVKCIHRKPGKVIVRYRLSMKKPDGTCIFAIKDGAFTSSQSEATIFTKQPDVTLADAGYTFILDQVGDYILELETMYRGGESSKDSKLVRILKSSALVKYKLDRILNEDVPFSLFFDSDHRLKILTTAGALHSLALRRDGVLVDYENKILYFSEDYSSVDVG
jgi:hypothetical protein